MPWGGRHGLHGRVTERCRVRRALWTPGSETARASHFSAFCGWTGDSSAGVPGSPTSAGIWDHLASSNDGERVPRVSGRTCLPLDITGHSCPLLRDVQRQGLVQLVVGGAAAPGAERGECREHHRREGRFSSICPDGVADPWQRRAVTPGRSTRLPNAPTGSGSGLSGRDVVCPPLPSGLCQAVSPP